MKNSILIVDDSEDTRELFKATLEAEGFAVMAAKDGQQALDILAEHGGFSLMLLDLRMPEMSGFEVLEEMRRRDLGRTTPVMVVSAVNELPTLKLPENVIGTLKKPFFYPELIFKIKSLLEPESNREAEAQA
jgi:putative two-component system response regulator